MEPDNELEVENLGVLKQRACPYCGATPILREWYKGLYRLECERYSCNNANIAMGTSKAACILKWNEIVEELSV